MIVYYYYTEQEKHSYLIEKYLHIFSDDFIKKIFKFRCWQNDRLSLLGRVMLNFGLESHFNITKPQIEYNPKEKTLLLNHEVYFNISYTSNLVA